MLKNYLDAGKMHLQIYASLMMTAHGRFKSCEPRKVERLNHRQPAVLSRWRVLSLTRIVFREVGDAPPYSTPFMRLYKC